MAFYQRYKLSPFKLTQCQGAVSTKLIHRGEGSSNKSPPEVSYSQSSVPQSEDEERKKLLMEDNPQTMIEPTCHELERKAAIKGWERLREEFVKVRTECSAMPLGQTCILCKTPAEFRCQNCGPVAFYCHNCLILLHRKTNFFHVAEKWEASNFVIHISFSIRGLLSWFCCCCFGGGVGGVRGGRPPKIIHNQSPYSYSQALSGWEGERNRQPGIHCLCMHQTICML